MVSVFQIFFFILVIVPLLCFYIYVYEYHIPQQEKKTPFRPIDIPRIVPELVVVLGFSKR